MPSRAVRFSEQENEAIKTFLEKNPYFDFSTIARMAILKFIENPQIEFTPSIITKKENINKQEVQ
ncbi:MAG: hypothetical protein H6622_08045 [Halobacteriovoraceae bacterium]|nr:hypothetical protein [Halobacteriovoraceae bacterium]